MSIFKLFGPPKIKKLKANRDTKGLIKAIHYGNSSEYEAREVREEAIVALGELGDPASIKPLIAALDNYNFSGLQEVIVDALGHFKDLDEASQNRLREIKQMIIHSDIQSRQKHKVLKSVHALLKDESVLVNPSVVVYALRGWANPSIEEREDSKAVLKALLKAIGKIGDVGALQSLLDTELSFHDNQYEDALAKAIAQIAARDRESAISILIYNLQSTEYYNRNRSIGALKRINWEPENDKLRAAATVAEQKWNEAVAFGEAAIEPLSNAFGADKFLFTEAIKALAQIDDVHVLKPLLFSIRNNETSEVVIETCLKMLRARPNLVPTNDLREMLQLENVKVTRLIDDPDRISYLETLDLSTIKELAREELTTRGEKI